MAGIIHVLDSETIDKIAAGEVVERPSSVVKELVENSIDSGADKITVEIKEGGISFLRVTDNGCGIALEDLPNAFVRHATSKIENAEDLSCIVSLGFRGEALSSICAVSQLEIITKKKEKLTGIHLEVAGGVLGKPEEIGAPDGTTILVRNIFYNTPVRKKFLKSAMTEASYISELLQHMALSHPKVAFSFIQNGQTRFFTSGNGDLKEVIFRIFGKETADQMLLVDEHRDGIYVHGYIGKPMLARANRSNEIFFVNGRYIKSKLISSAVEDGYKTFLMQHKYPFVVLHFDISQGEIDVNVHPTKMEIRINNPIPFCEAIRLITIDVLSKPVLIPTYEAEADLKPEAGSSVKQDERPAEKRERIPESFEVNRLANMVNHRIIGSTHTEGKTGSYRENVIKADDPIVSKVEQMELFSSQLHKMEEPEPAAVRETAEYEPKSLPKQLQILGQVFDTYWIISMEDQLYFVDQHAAHEKVYYERFMKRLLEKTNSSQLLFPAIVVSLSDREKTVLNEFLSVFQKIGFEIEDFGGNDINLRAVPQDLYGTDEKTLFLTVLDELAESPVKGTPDIIQSKIASMSCKAAVKGNQHLSEPEARNLLKELFTLDNPYQCPHGRPTMFSMSKTELEKKFKRIL